ncbi:ArnT family glycosyltransferase [Kiritimatiella glycovorans]|uniref:Glycosyltransferase RgtA/B/C/D-like domain-containing protein n=1 Tax=Kiritimatiella glycovorans TaxID=1307763 RepID=A0A0G3EDJ0_9BACT|nr:glycosyltransferase family 39 protein [Kiritimatiella glycovorans]AKJ63452.1 hypothetical protein L21SP4_00168 [Kiritimatiella glycovorans]
MAKKGFEPSVQDLVYSVDAGLGLRLLRLVLAAFAVLFLALLYTGTQYRGFKDSSSMEYAQLGRNLAVHNRLITYTVRPATIHYLTENTPEANPRIMFHPDVLHPPMYPAVLAAPMKLMNALGADLEAKPAPGSRPPPRYPLEQWLVVPLNHLFLILTGVFLFLLARRLFAPRIAMLSVLVYFLTDAVWADSIAGGGLPLLSFFIVAATYGAVVAERRWQQMSSAAEWMGPLVLSAVAAAFAFLTRYAGGAIAAGLFIFLLASGWSRHRGWLPPLIFTAVFVLALSPWLVRNVLISGDLLGMTPWLALSGSPMFEGQSLMRDLTPAFSAGEAVEAVRSRWVASMAEFYGGEFFALGGGILVGLFLISFLYKFERRYIQLLRYGVLAALIVFITGAAAFGSEALRGYHAFWPLILVFGWAYFHVLLDQRGLVIPLLNNLVTGVVVVLCVLPFLFRILPPRAEDAYPPYFWPQIQRLCGWMQPQEVICTDMPWATAWYGNRVSVLLPEDVNQYYEINDYRRNMNALYFTTITKNKGFARELIRKEQSWLPLMNGRTPEGFPLQEGFNLNKHDQMFLTDYPRWAGQMEEEGGE